MRPRKRSSRFAQRLLAPAVIAALLAQAAPVALADDPTAELNKALDKQKYIQEQRQQAENELSKLYWEAREAEYQLNEVRNELQTAEGQLAVITSRRADAEAELAQIEADLAVTQARYDQRKALLGRRIRAINEGGRVNYVAVLLGSNTFADFISRFDMLKVVVKRDGQLFDQVRDDKKSLETQQLAAEATRSELMALEQRAQERRTEIAQRQSQREVVSRGLAQNQRDLKRQLDDFDRQAEIVRDEIWEIQRKLNKAGGAFSPIPPVKRIIITDSFGGRMHPILGTWRQHNGTDFAASMGDPVYAIEAGEVIVARWDDAYGNLIVIDHGGGIASWYGHSSQFLVRVGDKVVQGQQIAKAGSTGWSTGPHVHLEIHVNGKPVDPMTYLD